MIRSLRRVFNYTRIDFLTKMKDFMLLTDTAFAKLIFKLVQKKEVPLSLVFLMYKYCLLVSYLTKVDTLNSECRKINKVKL